MPLREILQQWDAAVKAYKASQYTEALTMYRGIEELSARMYYNMSCVHIKLQQFSEAIEVCLGFYLQYFSVIINSIFFLSV